MRIYGSERCWEDSEGSVDAFIIFMWVPLLGLVLIHL